MAKIVLFEMNEIPSRVLDHYIAKRPQSALARVAAQSRRYETVTEDQGHLSPWITWPSLHRGVANDRHYISDFGQTLDEIDTAYPPVWNILARSGAKVGVFNSLHSYPLPPNVTDYSFFVPDPFASGSETHPRSIEPFQALNLALSRESGRNVSAGLPARRVASFAAALPGLGITASTIAQLGGQLLDERRHRWKLVRRRTYQSVLSFDIFMKQLAMNQLDFSTFFTNHVASAMHRYWAAAFPEDWDSDNGYDDAWRGQFSGEIFFAMDKLDAMVARVFEFVGKRTGWTLMLATSMGQEAVDNVVAATFLYVADKAALMAALGVGADEWQPRPAMVPQFNVAIAEGRRVEFERRLARTTINGTPLVYRQTEDGFFSIDFGHVDLLPTTPMTIDGRDLLIGEAGLAPVEIQDRAGTNAYHIPEGVLLVWDGSPPPPGRSQISTLDIAPAILGALGQSPPSHMRARRAL